MSRLINPEYRGWTLTHASAYQVIYQKGEREVSVSGSPRLLNPLEDAMFEAHRQIDEIEDTMDKKHPYEVGDKVQTLPGTRAYPSMITVTAVRWRADGESQVKTDATGDEWYCAYHFRPFDARRGKVKETRE